MVSDFFVPNLGGVEMHIYNLAQCLIDRGHKVIVITSTYSKERVGVRHLTNGLKVYHLPTTVLYSQTSMPDVMFQMIPIFRYIFVREQIEVVHGHQATAVLQILASDAAFTMGMRMVYTDHSLFGFADAASIHINKTLKWKLAHINACITVSHCNKENLSLRAFVPPDKIFVIPNAVDTNKFTPNPSLRFPVNTINIVSICRLTYRKGVDLLVMIIPEIIRKYPNVHFIIGGDGPKMQVLQEMREQYNIADKVELLGSLPHSQVRDVLCRGHIFLNTSLTEAFCIAILEAASCGLLCVSTNVGGIPEVLPPDIIYLAPARPKPLIENLEIAISKHKNIQSTKMHNTVKKLYSWHIVAERTEKVYYSALKQPRLTLLSQIKLKMALGPISGVLNIFIGLLTLFVLWVCELIWPDSSIDLAEEFPNQEYMANPDKFGNHEFKVKEDPQEELQLLSTATTNTTTKQRMNIKQMVVSAASQHLGVGGGASSATEDTDTSEFLTELKKMQGQQLTGSTMSGRRAPRKVSILANSTAAAGESPAKQKGSFYQ